MFLQRPEFVQNLPFIPRDVISRNVVDLKIDLPVCF